MSPKKICTFVLLFLAVLWAFCIGLDRLSSYSQDGVHRAFSEQILNGRLDIGVAVAERTFHDFQIFSGNSYSNWQYGVPILQTPFRLLEKFVSYGLGVPYSIPDFAILTFWGWLSIWFFVSGVFAGNSTQNFKRVAVGIAVPTLAVYWLLPSRLAVYEETIAYFQFCYLGFFGALFRLLAPTSATMRAVWARWCSLFLGYAVLVRPTGLFYFLGFNLLLTFFTKRKKGDLIVSALPLVVWLGVNYMKSGSFTSVGFENIVPGRIEDIVQLRFNPLCEKTFSNFAQWAQMLAQFFFSANVSSSPQLAACQIAPMEGFPARLIPVFPLSFILWTGLSVTMLIGNNNVRRRSVLAVFFPIGALAFVYINALGGIAYRYGGDFLPSLLAFPCLAVMLPSSKHYRFEIREVFWIVLAVATFATELGRLSRQIAAIPKKNHMIAGYSQQPAASPPLLPSTRTCLDPPLPLHQQDLAGWGQNCEVDLVLNFFIGTETGEPARHVSLDVYAEHSQNRRLRCYLNGAHTLGVWEQDHYACQFHFSLQPMRSNTFLGSIRIEDPLSAKGNMVSKIHLRSI